MKILKRNNNSLFAIIFLFLLTSSCKYFKTKNIHPHTYIFTEPNYIKQKYTGKIAIKLNFDTIKLKKNDERVAMLVLGKFKKQHNVSELQKMEQDLDTFFGRLEKDNDTIYFDYMFEKSGDYYLDGYIEDIALLRNQNDTTKARMLTNTIKISKKITILDNK